MPKSTNVNKAAKNIQLVRIHDYDGKNVSQGSPWLTPFLPQDIRMLVLNSVLAWVYPLAVGFLSFFGGWIGGYLKSYSSKSGELRAVRETLETITRIQTEIRANRVDRVPEGFAASIRPMVRSGCRPLK